MEKKSEEIRQEEYRKYQHGTQGIDVYEKGAFMAGFTAGELYAAQRDKDKTDLAMKKKAEEILDEMKIVKYREMFIEAMELYAAQRVEEAKLQGYNDAMEHVKMMINLPRDSNSSIQDKI